MCAPSWRFNYEMNNVLGARSRQRLQLQTKDSFASSSASLAHGRNSRCALGRCLLTGSGVALTTNTRTNEIAEMHILRL